MARIKAGQVYGKWTTVEPVKFTRPSGRKEIKWSVVCVCGKEQLVTSYDLSKGKTTQCKTCYGTETKDLTGKRFGSWIVEKMGERKNGKTHWICICNCRKKENVCAASLTKKVSVRCRKCYYKTKLDHGMSSHYLYATWNTMISRCENTKNISYKDYGLKGITVCKRWKIIENFLEDMGERPHNHTIDRIDNSKGYYLENCRWATHKEQANNRTNNVEKSNI